MQIFRSVLLLIGCWLIALPAPLPGQIRAPVEQPDLEAIVDAIVEGELASGDASAAAVAVVWNGTALTKGYGMADSRTGRLADTDTLFRIGSITKTFIWLSLLNLEREGKVDLDRDVNAYFDTPIIPRGPGGAISLRDIMTHRTGFEDSGNIFYYADRSGSAEKLLRATTPARVAEPGERIGYSNWAAEVGALVVERVSGQPFEAYVRKTIFRPAGMKAARLGDPDPARIGRYALPVLSRDGKPRARPHARLEPLVANGSAFLSVRDALAYLQYLSNEETGLSLATRDGETLSRPFVSNRFVDGFQIFETYGMRGFGHKGLVRSTADLAVFPNHDLAIFVAFNGRPTAAHKPYEVIRRIAARLRQAPLDQTAGIAIEDREGARELAGRYRSARRLFTGVEAFSGLSLEAVVPANPDGSVTMPGGERYVPLGNGSWLGPDGSVMLAERGADGRVMRLTGGTSSDLERQTFWQSQTLFYASLGCVIALALTTLFAGGMARWRKTPRDPVLSMARVALATAVVAMVAAFLWFLLAPPVDLYDMQFHAYPALPVRVVVIACNMFAVLTFLFGATVLWRARKAQRGMNLHATVFLGAAVLFTAQLDQWNVIFDHFDETRPG